MPRSPEGGLKGRGLLGQRLRGETRRERVLVVCGPTASGKSDLADDVADAVSEALCGWAKTVVVDSMQVYRELPGITNQARRRPAELVGAVSVTEEWTVARHAEAARRIIQSDQLPTVLDAGTGMYLNLILLDIGLAPKVPQEVRREALRSVLGAENERRAARAKELELIGEPDRGSIWEGETRYEAHLTYLRPEREALDEAIRRRAGRIVRLGERDALEMLELQEAGARITDQVLGAIGVREMLALARGEIDRETAEEEIAVRTRRLARRQMRWFDKLARTLRGRTSVEVATSAARSRLPGRLNDIIGA